MHVLRKEAFQQHIDGLELFLCDMTLEKEKKDRSSNQNRYYRGVVLPTVAKNLIVQDYDEDDWHEFFKDKFLHSPADDNGMYHTRSTTDLTTVEMEVYLEKIRRYAAEYLQCNVNLPNEKEIK